jgi:hypothetical protein
VASGEEDCQSGGGVGGKGREVTRRLAESLSRHIEGLAAPGAGPSDPQTWERAARDMDLAVLVVEDAGAAEAASYTAGLLPDTGILTVNRAAAREERVRATLLVLAEHLLYWSLKAAGMIPERERERERERPERRRRREQSGRDCGTDDEGA